MATIDSPTQTGISQEVDATFGAARASLRPPEYIARGTGGQQLRGGTYRLDLGVGPFLLGASAILWTLRNSSPNLSYLVHQLSINVTVAAAITAQEIAPISLFLTRGTTANYPTNGAVIASLGAPNGNMMRTGFMSPSFAFNNSGIQVASAAAGMSGATGGQIDNVNFSSLFVNGLTALGTAMQGDLYKADKPYSYPLCLMQGDLLVVQWGTVNLATGTVLCRISAEWSEVPVF